MSAATGGGARGEADPRAGTRVTDPTVSAPDAPQHPARTGRVVLAATALGLLGAVGWLVALALHPERALRAWVTAWTYGLSIALGALCTIMIGHVTSARWLVAVRRVAEVIAMTLPALALGVIPVLVGMRVLYPWATLGVAMPEDRALGARVWLEPGFFAARSMVYLGVWVALAVMFWRWSVAADERLGPRGPTNEEGAGHERAAGDHERVGAPRPLSAIGLILFAFTTTFAAIDWLMSMTPEWYSTAFGLYYFAGAMLAALSAMTLLSALLRRGEVLPSAVAASHFHALGRLMLTMVILWAYIAYSQGFLVWIADVPAEVSWYLARWARGWDLLMGFVVVGQFVIPFLALLSYARKHRPSALAWLASWLLVLHWLDLYWVVGPPVSGASAAIGWEHVPALATVLGFGVAFGAWTLSGRWAVPIGDPEYAASLRYRA